MAAAKNVPVDVEAPGQVALRIQQLAERGGSMPKAVRDFLKRVTDPEKPAMVYEELRDFASNISRLSANEFGRLTPAVAREVHALRLAINKSAEGAAAQAGKGGEYLSAMNEYRNAARGRELWDATKKNVLRYAVPGGIGAYGLGKLSDLVRGD